MKDKNIKKHKGFDADKAFAAPGLTNTNKKSEYESTEQISPDTFLAEKDEVKNAEEEFRKKNKTK